MKNLIIVLVALISSIALNAQPSKYWGQLTPGDYKIGYQDTILFNSGHSYELSSYKGLKPYFVNMWFPIIEETGDQIKYKEYLSMDSLPKIQALIDSIQKVHYQAFVSWGVTYDLDIWENASFSKEKQELAKEMLDENLNVHKTSQFPEKQFPTIIYHHGNGGNSFENSVLFEFLASHGYVIISADYHWPGLMDGSYTHDSDLPLEDVEFITKYADGLSFTDRQNISYVGHSWGGGMALRLNQEGKLKFKQYLIFDSTIEKQPLDMFREWNPHLDSLFRHYPNDFTTKSTVVSSRASYYSTSARKNFVVQPFPEFRPFELINKSAFTFITLKQVLNHGSYTSVEVMRASLIEQFEQIDSVTVKSQFETYQFLVKLTKDILEGTEINEENILIKKN